MEIDEETLNKILGEIIERTAQFVKMELQLRGLDHLLAITLDLEFNAIVDVEFTETPEAGNGN
jgi:hypothetical protein